MNYSERDLLIELAVANQTIKEAEEAFDKLRKDYHLLREHTDRLEAILREHNIPFPEVLGMVASNFTIFSFYL